MLVLLASLLALCNVVAIKRPVISSVLFLLSLSCVLGPLVVFGLDPIQAYTIPLQSVSLLGGSGLYLLLLHQLHKRWAKGSPLLQPLAQDDKKEQEKGKKAGFMTPARKKAAALLVLVAGLAIDVITDINLVVTLSPRVDVSFLASLAATAFGLLFGLWEVWTTLSLVRLLKNLSALPASGQRSVEESI